MKAVYIGSGDAGGHGLSVQPGGQFGVLDLDGGWINGGFMVMEPELVTGSCRNSFFPTTASPSAPPGRGM